MSAALIRAALRQHAVSILGVSAACLLYSALAGLIFQKVILRHPGFVRENLNPLLSVVTPARDAATIGGFIGGEYLGVLWVLILVAFVTLFTGQALARDSGESPLELLLAYPISRIGLLASRVAALTGALAVLVGGTLLGLWVAALLLDLQVATSSLAGIAILCMALGLALTGYTIVLAALLPRVGVVAAIAWALAAIFYAVDVASRHVGALTGLGALSVFHYFSPGQTLDTGRLDWAAVAVLAGVAAAGGVVGAAIFRRRDWPALREA